MLSSFLNCDCWLISADEAGSYEPKYEAKQCAESFPDGSIKPYSNYSTLSKSPHSSIAEVPSTSQSYSETAINCDKSIPKRPIN
jgi:hypothetical protein